MMKTPYSFKMNGIYLEDKISGYQTTMVEGRESLDIDYQNKDNASDGTTFIKSRLKERKIKVDYVLISKSYMEIRSKLNTLNSYLSAVKDTKIIFDDENDKYFICTYYDHSESICGSSVKGSFTFICDDPFKYAITQKEYIAAIDTDGDLSVLINNEGNVPAVIDYEIINNAENGYYGIVSENGAMQFGSIEEEDGETVKVNETLLNMNSFFSASDDIDGYDAMHPNYGTNGTLSEKTWFNTKFLGLGTVGTKKGNANGGLRTVTIPADSGGDSTGAKNFYCYMHMIMYAGLMGQTGEMSVSFLTSDNKLICGYNWYKTDCSGNTGKFEFVCYNPNAKSSDNMAGKVLKTYSFTTSHLHSQNPWYWDWGHVDIRKEGANLTFYYWGSYPKFYVPEIENMKCSKIQIAVKQWQDRSGSKFLTYLGFDKIRFTKMNVEYYRDIPNRYSAGQTIRIDGLTGHFYVDDMYKPQDEVIGTKYFKAPVGESKIKFYHSSFMTLEPTVKVKVREAWR